MAWVRLPVRATVDFIRRWSLLQRFAVASLLVFGLIGFGTAYVIGHAVQQSALRTAQNAAVENLNRRVITTLRPRDLSRPLRGGELARIDSAVRSGILSDRIVVVKIWNRQGMVVYATETNLIGRSFPLEDDVRSALDGHEFANVSSLNSAENTKERRFGRLLQVYVPIRFGRGARPSGAFEIYETYGPVGAEINALDRTTYEVLGAGLLALYVLLFWIVRTGSRTISRQHKVVAQYTQELEQSYRDTILSLAAAVDARDAETELHSQRVTDLALDLGRVVGLSEYDLRSLYHGGMLHDVGKIGVPDAILRKPGPLTEEEWGIMRTHPVVGYEMLKHVAFLSDALPVVRHHHERWDGAGYPDRLPGRDIPVSARIFAIADAFDAITSDRPYRRGSSEIEALKRIAHDAGSHFDPTLVALFLGLMGARAEDLKLACSESGETGASLAA